MLIIKKGGSTLGTVNFYGVGDRCLSFSLTANTYPFLIRSKSPSGNIGSALFDDQQCMGKRSTLGSALYVTTMALKYKVVFIRIGLGTTRV